MIVVLLQAPLLVLQAFFVSARKIFWKAMDAKSLIGSSDEAADMAVLDKTFPGRLRELLLASGCKAARLDDRQSELARAVAQLQLAVAAEAQDSAAAEKVVGGTSSDLPVRRARWWSLCASARVYWELFSRAKVGWQLRFEPGKWSQDLAAVRHFLVEDSSALAAARALEMAQNTHGRAVAQSLTAATRDVLVWRCVLQAGASQQDEFLRALDEAFGDRLATEKDLTSKMLNSFHQNVGTLGGLPSAFQSSNSRRGRRSGGKARKARATSSERQVLEVEIAHETSVAKLVAGAFLVSEPELSDYDVFYEKSFAKVLPKQEIAVPREHSLAFHSLEGAARACEDSS